MSLVILPVTGPKRCKGCKPVFLEPIPTPRLGLAQFRAIFKGTHKDDENSHVTHPMTLVLNDENIDCGNLYHDAGSQLR